MRIFLNGCGGLVGTRLLHELAKEHEVIGFRRSQTVNPPKGAVCYEGDVSEASLIYDIVRKHRPDVIIHNAAVSHPMLYLDNPSRIVRINVGGTMNSLEAARQFGVKRFVYISSGAVYGDCTLPVVPESAPRYAQSVYGATKIACEDIVRTFDVPSVSLRVGFVYGPGRVLYCPIRSLLSDVIKNNGTIWEKGLDQKLDYIHVDDVVSCIKAAALAGETRYAEYNVGGGVMIGFDEIVENAKRLFPGASIHVGKGTLGFDALGAMDITRAKEDFGWQPQISLLEGMRGYADALKKEIRG